MVTSARREARDEESQVQRRGQVSPGKWSKDCKQELWADVVQRSRRQFEDAPAEHRQRDGKRLEAAVISALRMGDVRKALQLLNSAPIAPKTEATLQRLKDLHPKGPLPEPLPQVSNPEDIPHFTDDLVRSALSTFGPGSAAGLFGIKPCCFSRQLGRRPTASEAHSTRACNYFARGRGPEFLRPLMAGGVSIALEKSQTAVRPLACGDPIRRLVAKCFCLGGKEAISKAFAGKNYGVGCKGGVEVVAHSLRDTLAKHKGSKLGLLKIDFKNAFNMVSRNHFMKQAHEMFPYMSAWTEWCYGKPTVLLYDHEHVIWSESGVQQGDPLGPLYFCCGLNPLVNDIQALGPTYNKWYMDDGGIIGDVEFLKKVWKLLKERGLLSASSSTHRSASGLGSTLTARILARSKGWLLSHTLRSRCWACLLGATSSCLGSLRRSFWAACRRRWTAWSTSRTLRRRRICCA